MNRRTWNCLISFLGATVCLLCVIAFLGFLGFSFDRGPFSSESRAQVLIRLQGGTRILLEADVPQDVAVPHADLQLAEGIVSSRLNAIGISAVVRIQGERHLLVESPDKAILEQSVAMWYRAGLLEFVDVGDTPLQIGQIIQTTGQSTVVVPGQTQTTMPATPQVYRTVLTGKDLRLASAASDQTTGEPYIQIAFGDHGTRIFSDFTSKNVGKHLAIIMDKTVIMSPKITSPITQGTAMIEGRFTAREAEHMVAQLRYGALPFSFKIVEQGSISK